MKKCNVQFVFAALSIRILPYYIVFGEIYNVQYVFMTVTLRDIIIIIALTVLSISFCNLWKGRALSFEEMESRLRVLKGLPSQSDEGHQTKVLISVISFNKIILWIKVLWDMNDNKEIRVSLMLVKMIKRFKRKWRILQKKS